MVIVEVQGVKCRALVDTGAGSSYASAGLLNHIQAKPTRSDVRNIEMLLGTTTRKVDIFHIEIKSTSGEFSLEADVTKIDKHELLSLPNPRYEQILEQYQHLSGVVFNDKDSKEQLPIHLILGVGEYAKINTKLSQVCTNNKWKIITHRNISSEHLNPYGLHLSKQGTAKLAQNFTNYLKNPN